MKNNSAIVSGISSSGTGGNYSIDNNNVKNNYVEASGGQKIGITKSKEVSQSTNLTGKTLNEGPSWSHSLKNNPFSGNYPSQSQNKPLAGHKRTESLNLKYSNKKNEEVLLNNNNSEITPNIKPVNKNDPYSDRKKQKIRSAKNSFSGQENNGNKKSSTLGIGFDFDKAAVLQQNKNFSSNLPKKNYRIVEEIRSKERELPYFEKAKVIIKEFGAVKAFSVNTHQGTVRNYNEDRVSILLNAQQRFENLQSKGITQCSMFGVYDGHGGAECCNF